MSEAPADQYRDNRSLSERFADLNAEIAPLLHQQHYAILTESENLKGECVGIPQNVDDDETEKTLTDLGARLAKYLKSLDLQRKIDKRGPGESADLVEKFFRDISSPLTGSMETVRTRLNDYKTRKAAAERARIEEQRRIALQAQREADEARRVAEEARRREAAAASVTGHLTEEIVAHETQSVANQAAAAVERPTVATTIKAESGAASGQVLRWTGEIEDLDTLDLEALRPFIKRDALDQAVRGYVAQYRDTKPLAGARIYQKSTTQFRS